MSKRLRRLIAANKLVEPPKPDGIFFNADEKKRIAIIAQKHKRVLSALPDNMLLEELATAKATIEMMADKAAKVVAQLGDCIYTVMALQVTTIKELNAVIEWREAHKIDLPTDEAINAELEKSLP